MLYSTGTLYLLIPLGSIENLHTFPAGMFLTWTLDIPLRRI